MTFTLAELGGIALILIGAILSILNIIDKTITLKKISQEPHTKIEERVATLETEMKEIRRFLDNDKKNIEELRAANNMNMQAQFAILSHLVTGNDINRLKDTQARMQDFLANRGINI